MAINNTPQMHRRPILWTAVAITQQHDHHAAVPADLLRWL